MYPPIEVVGEHQLRLKLQAGMTGRPRFAAQRIKPLDGTGKTWQELILWPIPDGEYALTYPYQVSPDAVDEDDVLPYGGHANTVIEACLAAAEEIEGKLGLHSVKYLECLMTSVGHDRKVASPKTLGYNRDRSDARDFDSCNWHTCDDHVVTYNGVEY